MIRSVLQIMGNVRTLSGVIRRGSVDGRDAAQRRITSDRVLTSVRILTWFAPFGQELSQRRRLGRGKSKSHIVRNPSSCALA
jgi:hypothetical protein